MDQRAVQGVKNQQKRAADQTTNGSRWVVDLLGLINIVLNTLESVSMAK